MLAINGTIYWAVACFNYGDDPAFNRQRYSPAWIASSKDNGTTWQNPSNLSMFTGRLSAPRFLQMGKNYRDNSDGYVYAYFPGAATGAFFSCNDEMLLARVPVRQVLNRSAYEFWLGP